jgi:hypothetical protein
VRWTQWRALVGQRERQDAGQEAQEVHMMMNDGAFPVYQAPIPASPSRETRVQQNTFQTYTDPAPTAPPENYIQPAPSSPEEVPDFNTSKSQDFSFNVAKYDDDKTEK